MRITGAHVLVGSLFIVFEVRFRGFLNGFAKSASGCGAPSRAKNACLRHVVGVDGQRLGKSFLERTEGTKRHCRMALQDLKGAAIIDRLVMFRRLTLRALP